MSSTVPDPNVHDYYEEYLEFAKRVVIEIPLTQAQFYINFADCKPKRGREVWKKYHK